MIEETENEVLIGEVIYVFASPCAARAFRSCVATGSVEACKRHFPPIGIYPPAPKLSDDNIE
jgi:hypothetical protein